MISVNKLMSLTPRHGARKACNTLELAERAYRAGDCRAAPWIMELAAAYAACDFLDPAMRALCAELADPSGAAGLQDPERGARAANRLRRGLEAFAGVSPADWDFGQPLGLALDPGVRRVFPGMRAYLEDLRSPFNVGSAFRTADAFGVSELLLSGFTPEPSHPRASRTALGAAEIVSWRRAVLDDLAGLGEVFALELRGEPLDGFEFPETGVAVVGSEELGVSPEALALCARRVSIPMLGAKGSLNVGVAFGVMLNAWRADLARRGVRPVGGS